MKEPCSMVAKLSRVVCKPWRAIDVEGVLLAFVSEEVEEDATASSRELNPTL